jgi:3-hydroxyisobutyrate dehydrogenase-like beta-hydroxyacid dehydrogenase
MAQLGFLGLGIMGHPMAGHLLKAGHEVALWTKQARKAQELAKTGTGTACATPREVAERSDYIFYCVGDSRMAREIATGKHGLIESVRAGAVVSDCSTISPAVSKEIGAAFAAKGAHFLDAPVTGSRPGAEKAALTFMIGGDEAVYGRAKPYMEIMGKLFYYCGAAGQGLAAKLAQNVVGAGILQAFCEGMILAVKNGVAPEMMIDILDNSAAKSGLASFKAPFILARDFTPNFSTKWMHKDIGLALESAQALDLPMPVSALNHQMLRAAIAKGWGDDDFISVIRVLEDWAGVVVRKS